MTAFREILTIGHSTHPIERFIELLDDAAVEFLADVRRYPGSRRNPQFGATALAAAVAEQAIGYEQLGDSLGGRRSVDTAGAESPDNVAWRNPSFRAYADHMASKEFAAGLSRLEELGDSRRTAIMCAEAHPNRCHRQLIADVLTVRGWRVVHLLADGGSVEHGLSSHAVVEGDRVAYPGQPRLQV